MLCFVERDACRHSSFDIVARYAGFLARHERRQPFVQAAVEPAFADQALELLASREGCSKARGDRAGHDGSATEASRQHGGGPSMSQLLLGRAQRARHQLRGRVEVEQLHLWQLVMTRRRSGRGVYRRVMRTAADAAPAGKLEVSRKKTLDAA